MNEKLIGLLRKAGFSSNVELRNLEGAGSDRIFYRAFEKSKSAIVMAGTGHGAALEDWIQIQKFLQSLGCSVPKIFSSDLSKPAIVVEDLGEMKKPQSRDYPRIIRELARLAFLGEKHIDKCPIVRDRPFDFEAFRQESKYFSEYFLMRVKKIGANEIKKFGDDFDSLALKLSNLQHCFCHRDFQSSNITVKKDKVFIIDFQSAKRGPLHYDLASLLWDPYAEITDEQRKRSITYYLENIAKLGLHLDEKEFIADLSLCAISRLMQALGAYGFLSTEKNKSKFLDYIPRAEKRLKKLLEKSGIIPELSKILTNK